MHSNYFLTALRTLRQNKFVVIINLISVSVAFSLCTIGYFNYEYNHSFNRFFKKGSHIYKVNAKRSLQAARTHSGISPMKLKESLDNEFTEIQVARIKQQGLNVKIKNQLFREQVAFVDPEFLGMMEYPMINGDYANLTNKSGILLTVDAAIRLFGNENISGEVISIYGPDHRLQNFIVEGVIDKYPANTSFRFDMILLMENYFEINSLAKKDWSQWVDGTFIHVDDQNRIEQIVAAANRNLVIQNKANKGQEITGYRLDHFYEWPDFEEELYQSSFRSPIHPAAVVGTISSAIAILLLACFNFINTNIALSRKRLKEMAIRKIMGSHKSALIIQFLLETNILVLVAVLFSGVISSYLTDPYNTLFAYEIVQFQFLDPKSFCIYLIGTTFLVGMIAGIYPAYYIGKFESIAVLTSKVKFSSRNNFAKALLTLQFAICFYNVFSLIVFVENSYYQQTLDRGYDVGQIINIPMNSSDQFESMLSALQQNPRIKSFAGTSDVIGFTSSELAISHLEMDHQVSALNVGVDYLPTIGIRLIRGQLFSDSNDRAKNIVVNEMLATQLGDDVLNEQVLIHGTKYSIVGIVEDFNLRSIMLNNKIRPTVLFIAPQSGYTHIAVRTDTEHVLELQKSIEAMWYALYPDDLYLGYLQTDVMEPLNMTNNIMVTINTFIAVVSLLISALGLYSLISLTIQSRIKEFGIRKVLGAPFINIVYLLNRDVIILLIIASIFGLIGASYVVSMLLEIIYAYHIQIDLANYILPFIIILLITVIAIGHKVFSAVRVNPIEHLKYE